MNERIEVRLFMEPPHAAYAVWIKQGNMLANSPVMETEHKPGMFHEPTFRIKTTAAQILMDDLWNSGIRPTEGTGSAGSLAATERHLADFRKLVEHHLKIIL